MSLQNHKKFRLELSETQHSRCLRCLFVDDSEVNLLTLTAIFKEMEIELETTNCVYKALHLCKSFQYDLIVMDYHMPEMNGIEVAQLIKNACAGNNRNTVFLAFSSLPEDEFYNLDVNGVMSGYLRKEF